MASAFGPSSRILSRNAASEINFRRQFLGDFRVLSFATHGLAREEIDGVAEPALVLTPRDSKTPFNDGLLTATEIAQLPLHADLVILSACNSAKFDIDNFAHEAAGLSTAFFVAGARSTLASLWSVDSEATAQLMELLANELARDVNAGSSLGLRRAIQRFLSAPEWRNYRHPRFWAAFLVFGDGGRPPQDRGKVSAALEPLDAANTVWGEWLQSQKIDDGARLESGYKNTGKYRVRGILRLVRDGRTIWEVGDDRFSFVLPTGQPPRQPMALAWNVNKGHSLQMELRTLGPDGRTKSKQRIASFGDDLIDGFVALANGTFVAATHRLNQAPDVKQGVTLHLLDEKGRAITSRIVPLSPDLQSFSVRLFPSFRGVWIVANGEENRETPETRLLPMGSFQPCMARKRADLVLVKPDLSLDGDERHLTDTSVWQVVPGTGVDVSAISVHDSCIPIVQSSSSVALLGTGGEQRVFTSALNGANTDRGSAFPLPDGWLLVSTVRRQLDAWKKLDFDYAVTQEPENIGRSFNSSQQTGLLLTRFDQEGHVAASSLSLIAGELWASDAYLDSSQEHVTFLGANNGARFVGRLVIP